MLTPLPNLFAHEIAAESGPASEPGYKEDHPDSHKAHEDNRFQMRYANIAQFRYNEIPARLWPAIIGPGVDINSGKWQVRIGYLGGQAKKWQMQGFSTQPHAYFVRLI